MKIEKQRKTKAYTESDIFVKRHGSILNLSSAVRDCLSNHEYVRIDIEGSNLIFHPSDDESDYKISIGKGQRQAKVCIFYTSRYVSIPIGVRLYGNIQQDGSIIIRLRQGV